MLRALDARKDRPPRGVLAPGRAGARRAEGTRVPSGGGRHSARARRHGKSVPFHFSVSPYTSVWIDEYSDIHVYEDESRI
eukprot:6214654-Pleurochrysis_carterae.AAC.2